MIARIAFGGSFIKITVPFDLNSYHTTLDEKETRISAQNFPEMDRSHRPALHGELDKMGQCLGKGSTAGSSFQEEGGGSRLLSPSSGVAEKSIANASAPASSCSTPPESRDLPG